MAAVSSSVMIASVCSVPKRRICASALSTPSTTAMLSTLSSHSVWKSSSVAAGSSGHTARARASARKAQPNAARSATSAGSRAGAMDASISSVSVEPQTPVRRILAFASTARAISGAAAAWR